MTEQILKPNNFDNNNGRIILATLTIQDCFNLYRDFINNWLTTEKFTEYYRMTNKEFNLIHHIHDKAEAIIIHRNLTKEK